MAGEAPRQSPPFPMLEHEKALEKKLQGYTIAAASIVVLGACFQVLLYKVLCDQESLFNPVESVKNLLSCPSEYGYLTFAIPVLGGASMGFLRTWYMNTKMQLKGSLARLRRVMDNHES